MCAQVERSRKPSVEVKATPGEPSDVKKAKKTEALQRSAEEIG